MSQEKVNIAALIPYKIFPPKMGGQKGIAYFYRFFATLVNLTCITTKNNEEDGEKEYEVFRLLNSHRFRYVNLLYFFSIRKIVIQKRITHFIIEHPYFGWLGILLKWFCNIKLVVHSHNIEGLRFKSLGKWWWGILWNYEKFTHKQAHINFFIHEEDREFAIQRFGLSPSKCFIITYGFELHHGPSAANKLAAKAKLCELYDIDKEDKILLFNGTLDYSPNREALDVILEIINPLLLAEQGFKYRILICGSKLPPLYNNLLAYQDKNVTYAGFVDDITLYFKGADIFLNPVIDGGGIKTKIVEALGYDLSVISSQSGAIGIPVSITGEKMKVIADSDWTLFAAQVILQKTENCTPPEFFDHFYWGNIAKKAFECIKMDYNNL